MWVSCLPLLGKRNILTDGRVLCPSRTRLGRYHEVVTSAAKHHCYTKGERIIPGTRELRFLFTLKISFVLIMSRRCSDRFLSREPSARLNIRNNTLLILCTICTIMTWIYSFLSPGHYFVFDNTLLSHYYWLSWQIFDNCIFVYLKAFYLLSRHTRTTKTLIMGKLYSIYFLFFITTSKSSKFTGFKNLRRNTMRLFRFLVRVPFKFVSIKQLSNYRWSLNWLSVFF